MGKPEATSVVSVGFRPEGRIRRFRRRRCRRIGQAVRAVCPERRCCRRRREGVLAGSRACPGPRLGDRETFVRKLMSAMGCASQWFAIAIVSPIRQITPRPSVSSMAYFAFSQSARHVVASDCDQPERIAHSLCCMVCEGSVVCFFTP